MDSHRTIVILGVSQFTQSKEETTTLHPVGLMKVSSFNAINDARKKIRSFIKIIRVVNIFPYTYADAARSMANKLGINHTSLLQHHWWKYPAAFN